MNTDSYLSIRQVAKRYSVGTATPWRWVREGIMPGPVQLSPGCTRWRLSDLEKWEAERSGGAA
jgi:prophage regulatory protein